MNDGTACNPSAQNTQGVPIFQIRRLKLRANLQQSGQAPMASQRKWHFSCPNPLALGNPCIPVPLRFTLQASPGHMVQGILDSLMPHGTPKGLTVVKPGWERPRWTPDRRLPRQGHPGPSQPQAGAQLQPALAHTQSAGNQSSVIQLSAARKLSPCSAEPRE